MRKIGKVKYNGKSTADLGVIVSGEASFDAAAPDYTSYQIPGKNGDLMLSNNRYLNIDVTYPAFIPADFEEKVQAIRNWMRSARSYARIEDNYDLLHFRLGMGKDVLPFEPSAENVGSNMSLVFDCKPQRFLYSGEEENQIGVWGPVQAASGDVVTFEDDENGAFKSIAASITPTQDLHGYDYPWPAGGGKNKIKNTASSQTINGLTFVVNDDGSVKVSGTAERSFSFSLWGRSGGEPLFNLESGETYTVIGCNVQINGTTAKPAMGSPNTFTAQDGDHVSFVWLFFSKDTVVDTTFYPQLEIGSTATTFAPYSNICPITGETEATVWRTSKNLFDPSLFVEMVGWHVIELTLSPNTVYTMSSDITFAKTEELPVYFKTQNIDGGSSSTLVYDTHPVTMTSDENGHLYISERRVSGTDVFANYQWQIEAGTTPTPFTPYSGTTYPISWQSEAGTVYGGTVDVVSGGLVVDRAMMYVDGSQNIFNVAYHGSSGLYYTVITNTLTSQEGAPSLISNRFRNGYSVGIGNCYITGLGTILVAVLPDQTITTREQAKQWFVDNPTQFVYALATPQTYQLNSQHIKTLLGLNNVWADSGTVTAEWGEDPFGLYNPTLFDALPLIKVKEPQNGCAVTVNGTTMTCSRGYTGTVTIDCELMDVSSGATNLNADWSKDFPKLSPGENSVAFSGADAVTIIPRWWEL